MKQILLFLISSLISFSSFSNKSNLISQDEYLAGVSTLAKEGDLTAQIILGQMFLNGYRNTDTKELISPNFNNAFYWYERAAIQGDAASQVTVGRLSYKGLGTLKSLKEASKWYALAANQGHSEGQFLLGEMYLKGEGAIENSKLALNWLKLSAEQNNVDAQLKLGKIYSEGIIVKKDLIQAYAWVNLAAIESTEESTNTRAALAKSLSATELEKAQKISKNYQKIIEFKKGLPLENFLISDFLFF